MKLVGHLRQQQALRQALESGQLHHTLLFSGAEGIGKKLAGRALARTLFCTDATNSPAESLGGCGECHHCTLVTLGNMPDLIEVDCEDKESGSTDNIRKMLHALRLRPFSGNHRVVIFDNAHALIGQAANALLKSLEEPRPGTYFILVTSKPHLMLQTIHSRSQRWGFHTLNAHELKEVLEQTDYPLIEDILALADGSIEYYKLLIEKQEQVRSFTSDVTTIVRGDRGAAMRFGQELAQDKDDLKSALTVLTLVARDNLKRDHEHALQWSTFLSDLGSLPYLLLKRHFAPLYLLQTVLLRLSSSFPEQFVIEQDCSIEDYVSSY